MDFYPLNQLEITLITIYNITEVNNFQWYANPRFDDDVKTLCSVSAFQLNYRFHIPKDP